MKLWKHFDFASWLCFFSFFFLSFFLSVRKRAGRYKKTSLCLQLQNFPEQTPCASRAVHNCPAQPGFLGFPSLHKQKWTNETALLPHSEAWKLLRRLDCDRWWVFITGWSRSLKTHTHTLIRFDLCPFPKEDGACCCCLSCLQFRPVPVPNHLPSLPSPSLSPTISPVFHPPPCPHPSPQSSIPLPVPTHLPSLPSPSLSPTISPVFHSPSLSPLHPDFPPPHHLFNLLLMLEVVSHLFRSGLLLGDLITKNNNNEKTSI